MISAAVPSSAAAAPKAAASMAAAAESMNPEHAKAANAVLQQPTLPISSVVALVR
jgi:hypothetical protein